MFSASMSMSNNEMEKSFNLGCAPFYAFLFGCGETFRRHTVGIVSGLEKGMVSFFGGFLKASVYARFDSACAKDD